MTDGTAGFWSYAHADNDRENNRITRLAQLIKNEYALLTGEEINLFVDRADLGWGDQWRQRIDQALQATTFFIPIITPTFFTRQECRNELFAFASSAKQLGLSELILPIRYIPVVDLKADSADAAKSLVSQMQYADWTGLRLLDETSAEYRQGINSLAQRLVELAATVEAKPSVDPTSTLGTDGSSEVDDDDDAPGLLDSLALFEPAAEAWTAVMMEFPDAFKAFTKPFDDAKPAMDKANGQRNAPARKIAILKRVAAQAAEPSLKIEELGLRYAQTLLEVDPGVRAYMSMIAQTPPESPESDGASGAIRQIHELVAVSRQTMQSLARLSEAVRANTGLSRDLRPVLRRVDGALRNVSDAQAIIEEWERIADETGY